MENILTEIERENNIREIFLNIFKEDGVSKEELEKIQTMADVINLAEENDFEEMYLSYMDF